MKDALSRTVAVESTSLPAQTYTSKVTVTLVDYPLIIADMDLEIQVLDCSDMSPVQDPTISEPETLYEYTEGDSAILIPFGYVHDETYESCLDFDPLEYNLYLNGDVVGDDHPYLSVDKDSF